MKIKYLFKTAFNGLRAQRTRSGLTVLGIVIGVMAIIMVMAIGQGAEELILNQVRGFGSRTISVEPGREPQGPSDFVEMFTDSLKDRELEAIKNKANVRGVKKAVPTVILMGTVSYGDETKRTNVVGASDLYMQILDIYPSVGVMFTEDEVRQRARVAVIGDKIREELFGASDPIGQKIKIKNQTFRVIGLLPPKGRVSFFDMDELVAVPYTTAQKYLLGINYYHAIIVQAETEEVVPQTVNDIRLTLRELHDIDDPEKDDFHVMTIADAVDRVGTITSVLTILLAAVAAISLVVGGVGIMNIMLVSVTERTREIGLRKSLGATNSNIMYQFLLEAVMLTGTGGILGVAGGAAFTALITLILKHFMNLAWVFVFPLEAVWLGVGVSAIIGLIFGLYPASQAAKKSPIEALRYE